MRADEAHTVFLGIFNRIKDRKPVVFSRLRADILVAIVEKPILEKAQLTLIKMLSKTKKVITTIPPVFCSVASYKLFYITLWKLEYFYYYLCH